MGYQESSETAEYHEPDGVESPVRSLKEMVDQVSGKNPAVNQLRSDSGLAEKLPFPFLALVGQEEMKYALLLALINPVIGGVLLLGPRGTGKTTAVRSLIDLLPEVAHSICYYGCLPEDIEAGGIDAVCPDCAVKYARGEPLVVMDKMHLVELPLNTKFDDVIGVQEDNQEKFDQFRLRRGILSQADRNILFVDEINLLADDVVDGILDATSYGSFTVKRGMTSATFRSRFVLIATMNPEEGKLRPQIMDRFGLKVVVKGLSDPSQRFEVYQRVQAYLNSPHNLRLEYEDATLTAQAELRSARDHFQEVHLADEVIKQGLELIHNLKIESLRAEISLFEAARAYAALDGRFIASFEDVQRIAPMALRMRRSAFMENYLNEQEGEENEINGAADKATTMSERKNCRDEQPV